MTGDGGLSVDEDPSLPVSCPPGEINISDIALGTSFNTLYTAAGNIVRTWDIRTMRSVGKLFGGHQAALMALAVSDWSTASGTECVITGSKDKCLKV
jgi:kinesin family protein 4/21/27